MDYNKNNFHKENEENNGLPEGIFGKEEQFQAYAPEQVNSFGQTGQSGQIKQTGQTEPAGWTGAEDAENIGTDQTSQSQTGAFQAEASQSGTGTSSTGASQTEPFQTEPSQMGTGTSSSGNGYYGSGQSNGSYYQSSYQNSYQGNYQSEVNFVPGGASGAGKSQGKKAKRKQTGFKVAAAVLAGVLLVGGVAGGGLYIGQKLAFESIRENQVAGITGQENGENLLGGQAEDTDQTIGQTGQPSGVEATATMTDVSEVVDSVTPAIVAINCSSEYVTNFWGQQYIQPSQGSGSGIIIGQNKEEVLIVTNNHVVATGQNARNESIEVVFGDQSSADATIKGTEEGSDLAVISVKMADLSKETLDYIKIATLGDSDALKVGQMAIAIGNALGYGQSTTVGWISALDREIASEDYTMTLIQTDAAINPGNSGGALLNTKGEVIGINSAKYSDQSVEGMGFAIPISKAVPIINDLMNREEIPEEEQSYLGIIGQDVPEVYTERYGMPLGVYVYQVSEGSPAERAGLHMGDIITEFNGRKVSSMTELQRILATYRGGEEITLTIQVFEEGEYTEKTLHVTLGYKNQERSE